MNKPLVSVILIVKNGERYLASAINSVLNCNYQPLEIVVVDGHSSDSTAEIAKSFTEVRYMLQTNQGIANAYNLGIDTAEGELIAFISHDDLWAPNKLQLQVEYLIAHPEIEYIVTKFQYFLAEGCSLPPGFKKELLEQDHVGRIMETLVARKTVFEKVGKFNPDYKLAEDVDWYARAKDQNISMAVIPEVLLYKRVHNSNSSSDAQVSNQALLKLLRQSINRQRSQKV
jgi:glycosyltransferase involved in cell wall biosynthesis